MLHHDYDYIIMQGLINVDHIEYIMTICCVKLKTSRSLSFSLHIIAVHCTIPLGRKSPISSELRPEFLFRLQIFIATRYC